MIAEEAVIETDLAMGAEEVPCAKDEAEQWGVKNHYGYRIVKRLFDIVFSTGVLIVLLVPALILCVAIRIESPGNPIFVQHRVARMGKEGKIRTFPMLKFRSMYKDAESRLEELKDLNEADGPLFKIKDDPRVTRIGRFIRRHSIDEMPQFLNCWLGQMSTCGPRPAFLREVEYYSKRDMLRLSVKPGITGYWQIRGRSDTSFEEMIQFDLEYIEEQSYFSDIKIILKTIGVVFTGNGAW
ncbi:MAG: sugar transferase [Coriobacteriales bacterium]|jgi:lipopolysaccharide/colanic/teichoic acid biosynthesis glycosyltransferase|nr:sugar transferase [Coriobacteriales bacterium]